MNSPAVLGLWRRYLTVVPYPGLAWRELALRTKEDGAEQAMVDT